MNSDYQSTSVSFLDREGNLRMDGCFNSGSGAQGLSMTLSGDVVLPTSLPTGGPVVIIDRGNAALTWLDPTTCAPLGQLAVDTGFVPFPHDVVTLSASKAYVTRPEENAAATPAPGDFDDGDDLLIVDPTQLKIVGRIDLKPYAPSGTNILPRADRGLAAQGKVYVSLNGISADFKSYGQGRIVVVDPSTDRVVATIDLPGTKNCGAMTYLDAERKLVVACDGAFSDGPQQADSSAIVVVDLAVQPPAILAQVMAAAAGGLPFTNGTVAALDGNTLFGVTLGDFSNSPPDRLWALSASCAPAVKVLDSAEAFALGAVLVDAAMRRIWVADGTTNSPAFLRVFELASGGYVATSAIKTNPAQKLPPRALAFY